MEDSQSIQVFEQVIRKRKGIPVAEMKAVRLSDNENAAQSAVDRLKKKGVKLIEVLNFDDGTKTLYTKVLGANNYYKSVGIIVEK
jgi:hypothetical protein